MTTFETILAEAKTFKVFVNNVLKKSTYIPVWKKYFSKWEYTPTLNFKTYTAKASAAMVGSVIDFSSDKPLMTRPTAGQVAGDLSTIADRWQLDKLQIRQLLELEELIRRGDAVIGELYDFLFDDIEAASIVGMKRLDLMVLEGMSKGTITVDTTNNPDGAIWNIDLGISTGTTDTGTAWATTEANSKPLNDIQAVMDAGKASGIIYSMIKMSRATFNKMIASSQFTSVFGLQLKASPTKTVTLSNQNIITLESVNVYLEGIGLPQIELVEDIVRYKDGTGFKPFVDDRVLFSVDNNMGNMMWTYANEERLPEKTKVYAKADKTLISSYLKDGGRFIEYELNAIPAFGRTDFMYILNTSS